MFLETRLLRFLIGYPKILFLVYLGETFVASADVVPTFFVCLGSALRFVERLVYFPKYASSLLVSTFPPYSSGGSGKTRTSDLTLIRGAL